MQLCLIQFKSSVGDTNDLSVNEIQDDHEVGPDEIDEEAQKHRVCLLGTNDVGKTALVNQFLTSEYMNTYDASLGKTVMSCTCTQLLDSLEDGRFSKFD